MPRSFCIELLNIRLRRNLRRHPVQLRLNSWGPLDSVQDFQQSKAHHLLRQFLLHSESSNDQTAVSPIEPRSKFSFFAFAGLHFVL